MQNGELFISPEEAAAHKKYVRRITDRRAEAEELFEAKLTNMIAKYNRLYRAKFLGAILATAVSVQPTWREISKHEVFDVIMRRKEHADRCKAVEQEMRQEARAERRLELGSYQSDLMSWQARQENAAANRMKRLDSITASAPRHTRGPKRAVSPASSLGISLSPKARTAAIHSTHETPSSSAIGHHGEAPLSADGPTSTSTAANAVPVYDVPVMTLAEVRAFLKTPMSSMSTRHQAKQQQLQGTASSAHAGTGAGDSSYTHHNSINTANHGGGGGSRGSRRVSMSRDGDASSTSHRPAAGDGAGEGLEARKFIEEFLSLSFTTVEAGQHRQPHQPAKPSPRVKVPLTSGRSVAPLPRHGRAC
jgi:hypothetical protein